MPLKPGLSCEAYEIEEFAMSPSDGPDWGVLKFVVRYQGDAELVSVEVCTSELRKLKDAIDLVLSCKNQLCSYGLGDHPDDALMFNAYTPLSRLAEKAKKRKVERIIDAVELVLKNEL